MFKRLKKWLIGTAITMCSLALIIWLLWPTKTRLVRIEPVTRLVEHSVALTVAAASPDGSFLAVSDLKHPERLPTQVMIWSFTDPFDHLCEFDGPQLQCHALCFHPIKPLLAIAGERGYVTIADVQQQRVVTQFEVHGDPPSPVMGIDLREVRSMTFSPDGSLLAIGTGRREIEIWSTSDWKRRHTLPRHADEVNDLAFSANGEQLLSVGGRWESISKTQSMRRRPEVFLWDADSWTKISEFEVPESKRFAQQVTFVGDALAVVGNHGGELIILDTDAQNVTGRLVGHDSMISDLVFDDQRGLLLSCSATETIVWDMKTWTEAARLEASTFVAYDPTEGLLATTVSRSANQCILSRLVLAE